MQSSASGKHATQSDLNRTYEQGRRPPDAAARAYLAESVRYGRAIVLPPGERGDCGHQFAGIDWFREVNVKAAPKRPRAVLGSCVGRQRRCRQIAPPGIRPLPDFSDQFEAVHPRQPQVGDEDIGEGKAKGSESVCSGRRTDDLRAGGLENFPDHPQRVRIVVDHENANAQQVRYRTGLPAAGAGRWSRAAAAAPVDVISGRITRTVVPCPLPSLSAWIVPPCISTMFREIARPRPRPPRSRVVPESACRKRSNTWGRNSGAIPIPVSLTAIST